MAQLSSALTMKTDAKWVRWGSVIGLVLFALGLIFYGGMRTQDRWLSEGSKDLVDQVTSGPRNGTVVSNVGKQICLQLQDSKGNADDRKSCVPKTKILNLQTPKFDQPAVNTRVGARFSVHRIKDYGVLDGIVLVLIPKMDTG